jgi:N6-adenosine-specific RNA methylase IME4
MRHYDCMELVDIAALAVKDIVADEAALFLWVPGPHLVLGHHVPIMRAWGFQPSGVAFVWVKVTKAGGACFGGGFTTRKCVEYAVIGKRGRSVREHADVSELIIAPRREHSRKPDEFFARVERYSRGPYCELFARESRPSWRQWGDQATLFDKIAA